MARLATVYVFFFFFQAEDGIRDYKVTGVQTCALPISCEFRTGQRVARAHAGHLGLRPHWTAGRDRKSTRLNSSHLVISYAVFCLKKKLRLRHPGAADGARGR